MLCRGNHVVGYCAPNRSTRTPPADAWQRCRSGEVDARRFGISFARLHGLWFVAGSLVRDLAALNKVEMLPWDVWGAQPSPNELLDANQLDLFDQLAALTRKPDSSFNQLRSTYQNTGSLIVPETVYNALLDHTEPAQGPGS